MAVKNKLKSKYSKFNLVISDTIKIYEILSCFIMQNLKEAFVWLFQYFFKFGLYMNPNFEK